MKVGLIGVGLMNGSLALDLKSAHPSVLVYGVSRTEATLSNAMELGLIDHRATIDELKDMDLVSVAIPVEATAFLLPNILDAVGPNTLVIDMGSTKRRSVSRSLNIQNANSFWHVTQSLKRSSQVPRLPFATCTKTKSICFVKRIKQDLNYWSVHALFLPIWECSFVK